MAGLGHALACVIPFVILTSASHDDDCMSESCPQAMRGDKVLQRSQHLGSSIVNDGNLLENTTAPVGSIFPDGINPVVLPRKLVSGYPTEVLYKIPVEGGISVNETHAYIPFFSTIQAEVVRHMAAIGSYEYGVANIKVSYNPMSVVSNKAILGFAEKLHTLVHNGAWDTSDMDSALAERKHGGETMEVAAKELRAQRNALVTAFSLASKLMHSLGRAGIDDAVIAALRQAAGGKPSKAMRKRGRKMMKDLRKKKKVVKKAVRAALKAADSDCKKAKRYRKCLREKKREFLLKLRSSTATNCMHIERVDGLHIGPEGFTVPLETKIVSYRGQTVFSPIKRFSLLSGTARFYTKGSKLYLWQGMSTFENVVHLETPTKTEGQFFVGTVDGQNPWTKPDMRRAPHTPSSAGHYLYNMFTQIPTDYTYLFSDPKELCPTSKFEKLSNLTANFDIKLLMKSTPTQDQLMEASAFIGQILDCSVTFLNADAKYTHGFGVTEAVAFAHGLIEAVPETALEFLGVDPSKGDHWNELSG